jgi:HAD superfamily hydrolase (TIGR01450 family)
VRPAGLAELLDRYEGVLLDAYGVLVDKAGPLPGAVELIRHLNTTALPYFVLTNSASRLPARMATQFQAQGLAIPAERIITSGTLLPALFRERGLIGRPCIVMGPADARAYVEAAGGRWVEPGPEIDAEVIVIADQAGFPLLEWLNDSLSLLLRRLDAGQPVDIILCNPDLIYPRAPGLYGFTAGALAALFEATLDQRYGPSTVPILRLGKPHPPIFHEAVRRAGTREVLMIGDQLATDILGAERFGIDSALVVSGLARRDQPLPDGAPGATHLLASLNL